MSRSSRSQQQPMPPPDAIMGPPPLPPQIVFNASQSPANPSAQGSGHKSSQSQQDVSEKYSRLKRKYFELDEKLRDSVIETNNATKRNLQWRNERSLLLERIAELESAVQQPNSMQPTVSSAYPRSLSNPRAQKAFQANLEQAVAEAEVEDLDDDPLVRSRHIGPHIRKRQEAEQRERQEEEAREAKRQARRPRGSGATSATGSSQKHKEGSSGGAGHNSASAASTSRNDNSHHHHSPLLYAHSPSGQRDSQWLVSETGTRIRLKPPAPPSTSNNSSLPPPEPGAEFSGSAPADHAPMEVDSHYQPPRHSPRIQPQHHYRDLPPQHEYQSQNQYYNQNQHQHQQAYAVPPPPPPQFQPSHMNPDRPFPSSPPDRHGPAVNSPGLAHSSSRAGPSSSHIHSPRVHPAQVHQSQYQVQTQSMAQPRPPSRAELSQGHFRDYGQSGSPQQHPQLKSQERSESPFTPVVSPHEEKHTFLSIPPPPPPSSQFHQQHPSQQQESRSHTRSHPRHKFHSTEHPIIIEAHPPPPPLPPQMQMTLHPIQHFVTLSPSADYRATPVDPNKAAQSQMQITLRPTGGNSTPTGRPSELQRHAKPKRLKAHTVTSKNYSIPMVPRDPNGRPLLPLNVGIMTVYNLGEICRREHFHTERYIFPIGYEVTRRYFSTVDPNAEVNYRCKILDGGDGPKFQIIADDNRDDPILAGTATGAWSTIVKAANGIRNRQHSNSVSGPDFFGLGQNTIKHLIQELPGATDLKNYVWQTFVEGGPLGGRHATVIPALPDEAEINGSSLVQHLNGIEAANKLRAGEEFAPANITNDNVSSPGIGNATASGSNANRQQRRDRPNRDVAIGNGMATHFYSEQQGELIEIEDGERPKELQIIQVDSEDIHNGQPAKPRNNSTSVTITGAPVTMTSTIKPITFHQEYAIPPPPPPDPAQQNRKERRGRKGSKTREQRQEFEEYVPDANAQSQSPARPPSSSQQREGPQTPQQVYSPTQQQIPPPTRSHPQVSQSPYHPSQPQNGRSDGETRSYFAGSPPPPPPAIPATFASIMNAYMPTTNAASP